jgi:hypothetical protein
MGLHSLNTPHKDLYVLIDRVKTGPLTIGDVRKLFSEEKVTRATPLWYPGLLNWVTVGDIAEFNRRVSSGPPPIPKSVENAALWVHFQDQVIALTVEQLSKLVTDRKFRRADYTYHAETKSWVRADQHPLLTKIFSPGVDIPGK